MLTRLILLAAFASTWYMTGLIVFVHVVHYPLFARIDPESFLRYHEDHVRLTTYTVFLPMVIELFASVMLVYHDHGTTVSSRLAWAGLAAAVVTWVATGCLSVPLHDTLALGFQAEAHSKLVATNGVRLVAWIAHSAIMLVIITKNLK